MKKRRAAGTTARKAKANNNGASGLQLETVRELARIAREFDLAEIEADASGRIRVQRLAAAAPAFSAAAPALPAPAATAAPLALNPPAPASAETAPITAEESFFITSPFVGTFYRASSPDAKPFVDVGQVVRKGQVVCIVEAMKLMNEIEAEADGKVAEILVRNQEHVEYGQALFRLTPA